MTGTTYTERMSEVMPRVGALTYSLIRQSVSSSKPIEVILEDVREHAIQSAHYWRCHGDRYLDLLRGELITVAAAVIAEAVCATYNDRPLKVSGPNSATEKKDSARRKGVCMGKALLLSVKEAAAAIGVGERTVHKWILAEKIGHKIGQDGRKKIPLSALKKRVSTEVYEAIKENLEQGLPPIEKKPVKKHAKTKKPCCKACKSKKGTKRAGQH